MDSQIWPALRHSQTLRIKPSTLTHSIPSLVAAKHRFSRCKAKQSNKRRAFSQPLRWAKLTWWTLGQACFPRVKLCHEAYGPSSCDTAGTPKHAKACQSPIGWGDDHPNLWKIEAMCCHVPTMSHVAMDQNPGTLAVDIS